MNLLKVGQPTHEGVELLASDSRKATLLIDGQRHTLSVSKQISSNYSEAQRTELRIPRASNGHHMVAGAINGRPAEFLVDTGATVIAMSMTEARRLGLDLRRAVPGRVNTASGVAESLTIELATVAVGGLKVRNVSATVIVGSYPKTILLGNSFLQRVEMREERGTLVLSSKY